MAKRLMPNAAGPVLGVLGGLGPAATADFLIRIVENTSASCDQEHIPTLVYSDPSTPDRSSAILGQGEEALPALLHGVSFLNRAGVNAIAIPCNTAHYWHEQLQAAADVPVLNMIDSVALRIESERPEVRTIGLMSTDATAQAGIYRSLSERGREVIDLTELGVHNPTAHGIQLVKAGRLDEARELFFQAIRLLAGRGAEGIIYGCTEISVVLDLHEPSIPLPAWDSSEELALAAIDFIQSQREFTTESEA